MAINAANAATPMISTALLAVRKIRNRLTKLEHPNLLVEDEGFSTALAARAEILIRDQVKFILAWLDLIPHPIQPKKRITRDDPEHEQDF